MVELQIINKLLKERSIKLITLNNLTEEYFNVYKPEYEFITAHHKKFGKVPDRETFAAKFVNFEFFDVSESDAYLLDTIREERQYYQTVPLINEVAEILLVDAPAAVEMLLTELPKIAHTASAVAVDLIGSCSDRFNEYIHMKENASSSIIKTGFVELDEYLFGWRAGEDLITLVARLNEGKSWVLTKFMHAAWQQGKRVCFYSGEMSANMVGYRFDTLESGLSNKGMMEGDPAQCAEYLDYIKSLEKHDVPFMVITPEDLGGNATPAKLASIVEKYRIDILAVDQYSLVDDDHASRNDPPRIRYSNIARDLLGLSNKYKIPVIGVVQANRGGKKEVDEDKTPEIEHISESDAIAQFSTRVISMRNISAGLLMESKKNRYGTKGDSVIYYWDIDTGTFKFIPNSDNPTQATRADKQRAEFNDESDVF